MERDRIISPQRNWLHRYVIQTENVRQQPNSMPQNNNVDILEPVKQYYYQAFLDELNDPGPISELPTIQNAISKFIETIANLPSNFYSTNKELIVQKAPKPVKNDLQQLLNYTTAQMCRNYEKIADSYIKLIAEGDLLKSSKVGKLIRKIFPSEKERAFEQTCSDSDKAIKQLQEQFKEKIRTKYKR